MPKRQSLKSITQATQYDRDAYVVVSCPVDLHLIADLIRSKIGTSFLARTPIVFSFSFDGNVCFILRHRRLPQRVRDQRRPNADHSRTALSDGALICIFVDNRTEITTVSCVPVFSFVCVRACVCVYVRVRRRFIGRCNINSMQTWSIRSLKPFVALTRPPSSSTHFSTFQLSLTFVCARKFNTVATMLNSAIGLSKMSLSRLPRSYLTVVFY